MTRKAFSYINKHRPLSFKQKNVDRLDKLEVGIIAWKLHFVWKAKGGKDQILI